MSVIKYQLSRQEKLQATIKKALAKQNGMLGFAEFMRMTLFEPGLGYYSSSTQKFGPEGDFITAPEISPLFSRCLARQVDQIISSVKDPIVFELGAGTGRMAADIIGSLETLPKEYWILELSADLRQRQQAYLKTHREDFFDRIKWLDRLPSESFNGIILGNEVIDAMPVQLFQIENDQVFERCIAFENEKFIWRNKLADPELTKAVQSRQTQYFPDNVHYTSEINPHLSAWLDSLQAHLQQGILLFIDYGFPASEYYLPDRHMGTLMCHHQHRVHADPLLHVGDQDITSHVDFSVLADAKNVNVAGYCNQASFLINCGLIEMIDPDADEKTRFRTNQAIKQLTLPSEMGELFKAIALSKNFDEPLIGFSAFDQSHRL